MALRLLFVDSNVSEGEASNFQKMKIDPYLCRPQSIVLAGESQCKSALLLTYAYNAARRGFPSLYFKRRSDSLSPISFSGSDDSQEEEALHRICFKYVEDTSQIRCVFYYEWAEGRA